jgi:hypothetical protein
MPQSKSAAAKNPKLSKKTKTDTAAKPQKNVFSDGDDDDELLEDEGEGDELGGEENAQLELLEAVLRQCALCGPTKFCKINKHNMHVDLTMPMRRAWAVSLAAKDTNVTLRRPPDTNLFGEFHNHRTHATSSQLSHTSHFATGFDPQMMQMQMLTQMAMVNSMLMSNAGNPMAPMAPQNVAAPGPSISNSDPLDPLTLPQYSTIRDFLIRLNENQPLRRLEQAIERFEAEDFIYIDEICGLELGEIELLGITKGNAYFIRDACQKEKKRVDKGRKL